MSLNALDFLRAILPENGLYASWTKLNGKRSYNTALRSVEELCRHILDEDAKGKTVYHACASYSDERGLWNERKQKWEFRCQANVLGVRSLWMDIDGGSDAVAKGTGYVDALGCAQAVAAFAVHAQLPNPMFVASGSGLHVYWPLSRTLTEAEWFPLAEGLKHAGQTYGLKFDPARTSDSASVLRTPGTWNRKRGLEPVQGGNVAGPFDVAIFARLVRGSDNVRRRNPVGVAPATPQRADRQRVTKALLAYDGPRPSAAKIADHCAHIARFRDSRGNLPEPLWYAGLCVLAWCLDGADLAHSWSSGYAGYSEGETNSKLERAKQLTGATTCQKFESLDHGPCAACTHRGEIKSPVSLGLSTFSGQKDAQSKPTIDGLSSASDTTTDTSSEQASLNSPPTGTAPSAFGVQLPPLFGPYKWSKKSQLVMETEKDEKSIELLISEYPIYLESVQTGEINTHRFSYHFCLYLPLQGWIDIHMDAEQLMGPGGIAKLFGRGAVIHEPKAFMKYAETAIDRYNKEKKLRMRYEQFGWKDEGNAFLFGDRLYGPDDIEVVIGTDEVNTRAQFLAPSKVGSLQGWSDAANALFQLGCEPQSFGLLASFASVFTPFHSSNEGGAIVHFVSGKSGTGKTTTLAGVSTVWGAHKGLNITNIDTAVAKGITLGVLGNLPVVYDEMWDRDPMVVRDFVMTFTNGRDKMRGTRDGEIKHQQASWQTLLVSAANLSLVELLNNTSQIDAPGMRVLEFPLILPAHIQHSGGDRLRKALELNCGHAGDHFLRYLMQPEVNAWARQALATWTQEIWDKTKLNSEHRFWVRTLGSVSVAAALVTKLGLLSFQPGRIVEWAMDAMMKLKDEAPLTGRPHAAAEMISRYLAEHLRDTLIVADKHIHGDKNRTLAILKPLGKLMIRYEMKPGRIFIAEHPFRQWLVKHGINARELMGELKDSHVLMSGRRPITLSAGTEFNTGQVSCLEVNALHPQLGGALTEITNLQAVRQQRESVQ